jgi:hypothetical protein
VPPPTSPDQKSSRHGRPTRRQMSASSVALIAVIISILFAAAQVCAQVPPHYPGTICFTVLSRTPPESFARAGVAHRRTSNDV